MSMLPSLYVPSLCLVIDDNPDFLVTMKKALKPHFPVKTFSSPIEALNMLSHSCYTRPPNFTQNININETDFDENTHINAINFNNLRQFSKKPYRQQYISTIIVDYSMTEMNGIELCRYIKDTVSAKKIMMTGFQDHEIAIQAFNDGLIDQYIFKSSDIITKAQEVVKENNLAYYLDLTKTNLHKSPYTEQGFYNLFYYEFQIKYDLCEYYQIDAFKSFLGKDQHQNNYFLIVKQENQLEEDLKLCKELDLPSNVLKSLKARDNMLYLEQNGDNLRLINCIYPITGSINLSQGKYYYTIIHGDKN